MFGQWRTFFKRLRSYCKAYGGLESILLSPIFGVAIIITGASYSRWLIPSWIDDVKTLIPSLLGFSLGTYAIIFSIVTGRLRGALRQVRSRHGVSYLESINATFFHFIFVQVICLVWTFLYEGTWLIDLLGLFKRLSDLDPECVHMIFSRIGSFIGFLLLVYSVLLMVAAALAVYRLALIKDPSET